MATYDADGALTWLERVDISLVPGEETASESAGLLVGEALYTSAAGTEEALLEGVDISVREVAQEAGARGFTSTATLEALGTSLGDDPLGAVDAPSAGTGSGQVSAAGVDLGSSAAGTEVLGATSVVESDGTDGSSDGRTLAEWLSSFASMGIEYDEASGRIYYLDGGERVPVHALVDVYNGGSGVASYSDEDAPDGIRLRTVRDASGRLIGVEEFSGGPLFVEG